MLDRDLLGELGEPAEVIAVPVRDDQVVDLRQARIVDGFHDAAGIARRGDGAGVARVHQHRLTGGRDEERGIAAFHVDDIDRQRFRGPVLRECRRCNAQNRGE